jgi:hypothetical protein
MCINITFPCKGYEGLRGCGYKDTFIIIIDAIEREVVSFTLQHLYLWEIIHDVH